MASLFGAATDTQSPFSGVVPTQRGYNLQYLDSPDGGRQFYLPGQQTQAAYGVYNLPGDVWGQGTPYDFSLPSREVIDPSAQYPQYRMGTRAVTGGRLFNENPLAGEQDYYQPVAGEGGSFWKQIAPLAAFALAPLAGWAIGGALGAGAAGAEVAGGVGSEALLGSAGAGAADAALAGTIDFGGLAAGVSPAITYGAGGSALTAAEYASLASDFASAGEGFGGVGGAGGSSSAPPEIAGEFNFAGLGGGASQGFSLSGLLSALAGGGEANPGGIGLIGGGPFSKILGAGTAAYGLLQSLQMEELARKSMNKAPYQFDPFGMGPRAPYAAQLSALMANPAMLEKYPGYQAGLQAVTRNMASQGYLGSGNMMAALHNYGGEAFNRETSRLAQLAGAGFAPSAVPYDTSGLAGMAAGAELGNRSLSALGYIAASKGY